MDDPKIGWTIDDEIEWLKFQIKLSERDMNAYKATLAKCLHEKAYLDRLINFCNTGQ